MSILKITDEDFSNILYKRKKDSNKGDFGYIALIGGSKKYIGAIKLSELGAVSMRAGAGVCKIATPKGLYPYLAKNILESTYFPLSDSDYDLIFVEDEFSELIKNVRVVAIGMGIGISIEVEKAIRYLLVREDKIKIIDADGITVLSKIGFKDFKYKTILTPHFYEFKKLLLSFYKDDMYNDIEFIKNNNIKIAEKFARDTKCFLLLKGTNTVVTNGEETYIIDKGCSGMATAGSGDVLSGIISSIVGYNINNILLAVAVSAYINGLAGEIAESINGQISMISSDTANCVKLAINKILSDIKI